MVDTGGEKEGEVLKILRAAARRSADEDGEELNQWLEDVFAWTPDFTPDECTVLLAAMFPCNRQTDGAG